MKQDRERFWSSVDEALDARRDPHEDALVQAWIADHPDDREELALLVRRLDAVAKAPLPARRTLVPITSAPRIAAPMIAAAALVVLGVYLWTPTATNDAPLHRATSRVVSFSIEVTRESDGETTTVVSLPDHFERTEVTRLGSTNIVSSLESRQP